MKRPRLLTFGIWLMLSAPVVGIALQAFGVWRMFDAVKHTTPSRDPQPLAGGLYLAMTTSRKVGLALFVTGALLAAIGWFQRGRTNNRS